MPLHERPMSNVVFMMCRNGEEIKWSRTELASFSGYFRVLLFGNFRENTMQKIDLQDVDGKHLKILLNFYKRRKERLSSYDSHQFCRIFIENLVSVWKIIELADMLGLEEAAKECDKYLLQTMNLHNSVDLCVLAERYSRFSVLREAIRSWAIANPILQTNEICHCDEGTFCLRHCIENYEHIEKVYVLGGYFNEYIAESHCIDLALFVKKDTISSTGDTETCALTSTNLLLENHAYENKSRYYGPQNEECRYAAIKTDIYVTGGFDDRALALAQVWKFDTRKNKWSRVCDMRRARFYHCIATVGNHIYVCGGFDDNCVINTLERYHPNYNEWVELSTMLTGVGSAAYASYRDGIYVCCGQYGYKDIHTTRDVQQYSISTDCWSVLTTYDSPVFFPHSEYGLAASVVQDELIIFGGQTERCDSFDLKTKTWKRIANMKFRRMETSAFVHNRKLYAVGGYDYRTGDYHDTVEEYDNDKDEWNILHRRLPRPSRSLGICCIFDVERKGRKNHRQQ